MIVYIAGSQEFLRVSQWRVIDPLLPDPAFINGAGGRPEAHCRRAIVDAIFYVVDNGITDAACGTTNGCRPTTKPWSAGQ